MPPVQVEEHKERFEREMGERGKVTRLGRKKKEEKVRVSGRIAPRKEGTRKRKRERDLRERAGQLLASGETGRTVQGAAN